MNSSVATEKGQSLSESQRTALITLLSDEDHAVYHLVREKILSYGQAASAWMRPHVLSSDPILRRRAQEIIDYLARQSADNRFLAFCLSQHGEDLDVEQGSWLLSQTRYPDINVAAYQAGLPAQPPSLEVHEADNTWRTIVPELGIPVGREPDRLGERGAGSLGSVSRNEENGHA